DGQPELLGKLVVALVVRGYGHDRTGAVRREHVIGDPDRYFLPVDRVDRVPAREDARFFFLKLGAFEVGLRCGALDVRLHLFQPIRRRHLENDGCSGASTMYVAPKSVSGRVVKTRMRSSGLPATAKSTSAPSDRPIQFRCISLVLSGHSSS